MYAGRIVTPSRVCELKLKMRPNLPELILSHPHGCVSWNNLSERESRLLSVTPSRVCELKCGSFITLGRKTFVTPSRVCELKCLFTYFSQAVSKSHPHGCVSWNILIQSINLSAMSHPHGCVSWNKNVYNFFNNLSFVTPSRVCELKLLFRYSNYITQCHTLTGVWVEILELIKELDFLMSHPHGCVSWNDLNTWFEVGELRVTPSRVCELKSCPTIPRITHTSSHPHGCVSWNL